MQPIEISVGFVTHALT